jgi:hypothetical protein
MPPLLDNKNPASPSVFRPAALLREARRQKRLPNVDVPAICVLDPDGDIVRSLRTEGRSKPFENWPCYHTQLDAFELGGQTVGIVGCAVGAPFAVLIAEELFECGCRSNGSAETIDAADPHPTRIMNSRRLIAAPGSSGQSIVQRQTGGLEAAVLCRVRVISRHSGRTSECPLYPQKQTSSKSRVRVSSVPKCDIGEVSF